jgi:hypothetical protein
MMRHKACLIFFAFIFPLAGIRSQVDGCIDPRAKNFLPSANHNNGGCRYKYTQAHPLRLINKLPDTLNEISGMVMHHGQLWAHNDGGNPGIIYHIDKSNGHILQSIYIRNARNIDWEDIAADENYLYIGDFGNNNGNREDLCIYKIPWSKISSKAYDTATAEKISFRYGDQTDFTSRPLANRYDCEALVAAGDSLHLFSKNWSGGFCRHYSIPLQTGSYIIYPLDSFSPGGLITGAAYDASSSRIVLTGYQESGSCFLWLLWNYEKEGYLSGNKRRIELGFFWSTGQIEAVCFNDSSNIYISNENRIVPNRLFGLYLGDWMDEPSSMRQAASGIEIIANSSKTQIKLKYFLKKPGMVSYCIYAEKGNLAGCYKLPENGGPVEENLSIEFLEPGRYFIILHSGREMTGKNYFIKD